MKRYKYITSTGEDAFSSSYDEASWFDVYGYAGVRDGKQSYYINNQGVTTLKTGYGLTMFDEDGLGLIHDNKNGIFKYDILSAKGELVIPIVYKGLGYRSRGLYCASLEKEDLCLDSHGHKGFQPREL